MLGKLLQPEIRNLVEAGDYSTLHEVFEDWLPADLAELLNDIPEEDEEELQGLLFKAIPQELKAATFEYLEHGPQEYLLAQLPPEEIGSILNDMAPDDRTALFENLNPPVAARLMLLLTPEERAIAQTLLGYPENSVGRLMTPDYIAVRTNRTIRQVLDYIRMHGRSSETLNVIYAIDGNHRLIDDILIHEILLAPLDSTVEDIMDGQYLALRVTDDQETAVEVFRKYDRTVLPVVDPNGVLVGIVTIDDVLDVADEEATEDIQKFGGLEALDEPYIDTPVGSMVKKRATWLIVLFIGEMLTTSAMAYFEDEIKRAVVLSLFIPLIVSSGGNSGSQAATLVIRALALGEVTVRDWWRVMRREIYSGILLGLILGIIGFLRIVVWWNLFGSYGEHAVLIGLTVGITLVSIVLLGTLAGSMLPILLKKFGADPAASSAPFVATLVDVTGLLIYFTVAVLILTGTVL